jgi:riboflavin biosynthesis pyrimidine reductase
MVYGRGMYEVMHYWDDDSSNWNEEEREFCESVAELFEVGGVETRWSQYVTMLLLSTQSVVRGLKTKLAGEIEVAGPNLAGALTDLGLSDEYPLYLPPNVLGSGKPFFVGSGLPSALWRAI